MRRLRTRALSNLTRTSTATSETQTDTELNFARAKIELKAGAHQLAVTSTGEAFGNPVQIRLARVTPDQEKATCDAAIAAAKQAKKAVVFAWGRDRPETFQLTPEQTRLIRDVASVNANTVVVLSTSLPVAMPWLQYLSIATNRWETATGPRPVFVGASSRDLRLQGEVTIAR